MQAHVHADMQLKELESSTSKSDHLSLQDSKEPSTSTSAMIPPPDPNSGIHYRLYKRRFAGMLGFVSMSLSPSVRNRVENMSGGRIGQCYSDGLAVVWAHIE